jgi:hypothetical protein
MWNRMRSIKWRSCEKANSELPPMATWTAPSNSAFVGKAHEGLNFTAHSKCRLLDELHSSGSRHIRVNQVEVRGLACRLHT